MNEGLNLDMTEEKPIRKLRNNQTTNKKIETLTKNVAVLKTENKQLSSEVKKLQKALDKKPVQINIAGNKYNELLNLFTDLKNNKISSAVNIAKRTPFPEKPTTIEKETTVPKVKKVAEKPKLEQNDFQEQPDDETTIEPEDDQSFDEADEKEKKSEIKSEAKVSQKKPETEPEDQDEEEKVVLPSSDEEDDGLSDFFNDDEEDEQEDNEEKDEDDEIKIDSSEQTPSSSIKSESVIVPKEVEAIKTNPVEQPEPNNSDNEQNDQKESEASFRELVNMDKLNLSENEAKDPVSELFADDDESISDEINNYFHEESDNVNENDKAVQDKEASEPVAEKQTGDKQEDTNTILTEDSQPSGNEPAKEINNSAEIKSESNPVSKIRPEAASESQAAVSVKEKDSIDTASLDPKKYDDGSDDDLMEMDDLI